MYKRFFPAIAGILAIMAVAGCASMCPTDHPAAPVDPAAATEDLTAAQITAAVLTNMGEPACVQTTYQAVPR